MELAKMDRLGRVVVPARLRRALGLRAGTALRAERSGGGVLLTPVRESAVLRMARENPIRLDPRVARTLTPERIDEMAEEAFEEEARWLLRTPRTRRVRR